MQSSMIAPPPMPLWHPGGLGQKHHNGLPWTDFSQQRFEQAPKRASAQLSERISDEGSARKLPCAKFTPAENSVGMLAASSIHSTMVHLPAACACEHSSRTFNSFSE